MPEQAFESWSSAVLQSVVRTTDTDKPRGAARALIVIPAFIDSGARIVANVADALGANFFVAAS